ncbi:hypothetical protein F4604DRAFT_1679092 [Suillus subluteus]|nr:hypothetical protein F4604DRAFT_1679092 [Suillus subluteus]
MYVPALLGPSCEEFDWLVDYLAHGADHDTDDETKGDSLLALSAMHGLGSSTKRRSYIESFNCCMGPTKSSRVRYAALKAVYEAQEELASITSAPRPQDIDAQLLDELSRVLLTAVRPDGWIIYNTGPDASFHFDRDYCYISVIYDLTKNDEWCQRLIRDGHLARCISLVDGDYTRGLYFGFYLLITFGRIMSLGEDLPFSPAEARWRLLIASGWDFAGYFKGDDYVDGIAALVTATRLNLTASYVPREWFADLAAKVHIPLAELKERQAILVNGGAAQSTVGTVLSSMQELYDNLKKEGGTSGH